MHTHTSLYEAKKKPLLSVKTLVSAVFKPTSLEYGEGKQVLKAGFSKQSAVSPQKEGGMCVCVCAGSMLAGVEVCCEAVWAVVLSVGNACVSCGLGWTSQGAQVFCLFSGMC